jgi:hypothetical protein
MTITCTYEYIKPDCNRNHLPLFISFLTNRKIVFKLDDELAPEKVERILAIANQYWFNNLTVIAN